MSWLISAAVKGALEFLFKFFGGLLEGYLVMRGNEKRNEEIKEHVEAAQTPEEIQAALNEAASRLGGQL
jgi:hypothetical protein